MSSHESRSDALKAIRSTREMLKGREDESFHIPPATALFLVYECLDTVEAALSEIPARQILTDVADWGISHKASCPQPASNFQKNQPCKCGRDALLNRVRVAIGRAEPLDANRQGKAE
jgi:hypothetical protein